MDPKFKVGDVIQHVVGREKDVAVIRGIIIEDLDPPDGSTTRGFKGGYSVSPKLGIHFRAEEATMLLLHEGHLDDS